MTDPGPISNSPSSSMKPSESRTPALDAIRGIAVLMIVVYHWSHNSMPGGHGNSDGLYYLSRLTTFGWTGVDLFFVLSGFLIGGIIFDRNKADNFFKVFYIRRFLRIVPLYAVLLISFYAIYMLVDISYDHVLMAIFGNPQPLLTYITFTQSPFNVLQGGGNYWLGVTWSLAIEEQFYLLIPLLLTFISNRLIPYLLLLIILLIPCVREYIWLNFDNAADINYGTILGRIDTLAVGVMLAWVVRNEALGKWIQMNIALMYLIFFILASGFIVFLHNFWNWNTFDISVWGYSWIAIFYGSLILIAYYNPPRILLWKPLCNIGISAYSLYLFHRPVGMIVHWSILGRLQSIKDLDGILTTFIAGFILLIITLCSWHFIEKPCISHGHKHKYEL